MKHLFIVLFVLIGVSAQAQYYQQNNVEKVRVTTYQKDYYGNLTVEGTYVVEVEHTSWGTKSVQVTAKRHRDGTFFRLQPKLSCTFVDNHQGGYYWFYNYGNKLYFTLPNGY